MKKITLSVLAILSVFVIAACGRRLDEVDSIQLSIVPTTVYERSEAVIDLSNVTVSVFYIGNTSNTPDEVIPITHSGVTLSGTGLLVANSTTVHLRRDLVGRFTFNVSFSDVSLNIEYEVNDQAFIDAVNALDNEGNLQPGTGFDALGDLLDSLNLSEYQLQVYEEELAAGLNQGAVLGDVWATMQNLPNGEFETAYQFQQVLLAAVAFRMATRAGREYALTIQSGDSIDFDILIRNVAAAQDNTPLTHLRNTISIPGLPGGPMTISIPASGDGLYTLLDGGDLSIPGNWDGTTFTVVVDGFFTHFLIIEGFEGVSNLDEAALADAFYNGTIGGGYRGVQALLYHFAIAETASTNFTYELIDWETVVADLLGN